MKPLNTCIKAALIGSLLLISATAMAEDAVAVKASAQKVVEKQAEKPDTKKSMLEKLFSDNKKVADKKVFDKDGKSADKTAPKKDAVAKAPQPPKQQKFYAGPYVGDMETYSTKYEDTLVQLALDRGIGYVALLASNPGIDPWMPGAGTKLILPTRHLIPDAPRSGVVINLPEMRLYYYPPNGDAPVNYPIGIGREGLQTPVGATFVRYKKVGPIWRPTPRMRSEDPRLPVEVLPGPDNPMGTHAMYLAWPEYAIHGTNKPFGIGRRSSSGCIRMYPADIIKLFPQVPENTVVTVVNSPIKAAWIGNDFYIEAHPSMEQALRMEEEGVALTYEMSVADMRAVMKSAGEYASDIDWPLVKKIVRERRGYPIAVAHKSAKAAETAPVSAPAPVSEEKKTVEEISPTEG